MKSKFLLFIAFMLWSSVLITCGGSDDRDEYRKSIGEPDSTWVQGADVFWRESWYYRESGFVYEFRRTQGCGADRNVYLYQRYFVGFVPEDSTATYRDFGDGEVPAQTPIL
ncbi:MAG: hypothetical protein DWQ05_06615 [Calditrichaeota bacterium]|nr:MAG: hypothetical protein DWQ05_06615 [Calditrichota bacterium]